MSPPLHMLLSFGGHYESTGPQPEQWQCGIRLVTVFGSVTPVGSLPTNIDVQARESSNTGSGFSGETLFNLSIGGGFILDAESYMLDYGLPTLVAWIETASLITDDVKLDFAKLAPLIPGTVHTGTEPEGKTVTATKDVDLRTSLWTATSDIHGAASGGQLPPQNAVGYSWKTGRLGRRGRGRIFTPGVPLSEILANGRLLGAQQTRCEVAAVALLEGLSYSATVPTEVHVRPIVTGSPWTDYGVITSVSVSDVVDTQRRRRDRLTPTRATGTPSYG